MVISAVGFHRSLTNNGRVRQQISPRRPESAARIALEKQKSTRPNIQVNRVEGLPPSGSVAERVVRSVELLPPSPGIAAVSSHTKRADQLVADNDIVDLRSLRRCATDKTKGKAKPSAHTTLPGPSSSAHPSRGGFYDADLPTESAPVREIAPADLTLPPASSSTTAPAPPPPSTPKACEPLYARTPDGFPVLQELKIREQPLIMRWIMSSGTRRLDKPPVSTSSQADDLWVHVVETPREVQVWMWGVSAGWAPLEEGCTHPSLRQHRLLIRSDGSPRWVLRTTLVSYRSRDRRLRLLALEGGKPPA
ncbi:hypothetical protein BV25DRAFT_1913499 [Artomyces pyxidatus]|uniref:Uncharacterized protein n=1 Tax=Artomyces pyxidatus TaxID=48021 RepID=A0ACB8TA46_9AGAM|nr:hypothetical protein BV25DRAFT_1913499 [Artomyces pyxidatus]